MGSNVSVMVGELEMWDSIPQLEQGSKRACGFEVCSPTVFSGSGLTSLDSPPGGAGWCRGADAPSVHAGVFGRGKRVSPGQDEIRSRGRGYPGSRGGSPHAPTTERGTTNHREGSIYWQKPHTFVRCHRNFSCTVNTSTHARCPACQKDRKRWV
jgi:hypothetical protein